MNRRLKLKAEKYISIGNNVRTKPRLHIAAIDYHNGLAFKPEIKNRITCFPLIMMFILRALIRLR